MNTCRALNENGTPCHLKVDKQHGLCMTHMARLEKQPVQVAPPLVPEDPQSYSDYTNHQEACSFCGRGTTSAYIQPFGWVWLCSLACFHETTL